LDNHPDTYYSTIPDGGALYSDSATLRDNTSAPRGSGFDHSVAPITSNSFLQTSDKAAVKPSL
jgi:hypothetical protein